MCTGGEAHLDEAELKRKNNICPPALDIPDVPDPTEHLQFC